ncbi:MULTISPECIES: sigma factor [unclassified Sutcliffiella]|uniref:sigma factor n=1 Tax=unclassified Sutcliffiella TaxID=2837532 RepID=UPI0030CE31BC
MYKKGEKNLNEESLIIKEIVAGKKEKYDQIIEHYKDHIYAIALWVTGNKEDAEGLVKEGFLEAYKKLDTYEESSLFTEWLYEHFLPLFKKIGKSNSTTPVQLPLHNPHYIKLEEAFHTLSHQAKLEFLLNRILHFSTANLSNLMEASKEEIEGRYKSSLIHIRDYTLLESYQEKRECHSLEELIAFYDDEVEGKVEEEIKDHLEFCPDCREVLEGLKKEEASLDFVLEFPKLEESFNRKVLDELVPYTPKKPKHRTWKYQLSVLGILGAIFLFSIFIIPNLKPVAGMVTTYIKHGTIYNVWVEGTYVATDKDISFEVTEVEMDSLYMYIYYDVKKEGEKESSTLTHEDIDFYSYKPIRIVDETGKEHPVQVTAPEYLRNGRKVLEKEGEYRPFFLVYMKDKEKLPDEFDIKINITNLQSKYGSWKLDIPIRYDKVVDTSVTVALNEEMNIEDKMILEFMDVTYSKHGSRFRYNIRRTDEERDKLLAELKKYDQEYRLQEFELWHQIGLNGITKEGNYLVPIYFHDMYMYDSNEPIEMHFSHYYMDNQYYEVSGKLEDPMQELYAQIMGVYYQEPAFFSLEIPLEETERTPLEGEINGYELLDYTIVATKDRLGDVSKYELIINGKSDNLSGEIGWTLMDGEGEYVQSEGWYHYDEREKKGTKKLLHVDITTRYEQAAFPEKLVIKADNIFTQLKSFEGEKFPLFKEEEKAEGGTE